MKKDLLSISDLTNKDVISIFDLTKKLKAKPFYSNDVFRHKVLGLIFQKPSNRTRVSFEVATKHLGGSSVYLGPDDIMFGKRESIKDISRVLSRYVQCVVLRTFRHKDIKEFARFSTIPVINGLSDACHPCQGLADIFTVREKLGNVNGKTLAYVGDGNNVLNSLLQCCTKTGMNINVATPKGYGPDKKVLKAAGDIAAKTGSKIVISNDPKIAVKNADVVYTDVWISMGQEATEGKKKFAFKEFQINKKLLAKAKKNVMVLHCLPAHRGEEITDDVLEGNNSAVFDQAENRLHVQKAIMVKLIEKI